MGKPLISISIENKTLNEELNKLRGRNLRRNMTNVVNKLAFDGTKALVGEMKRVFKNPTKFTLGAFKVIKAKPFETDAAIVTRDLVAGQNIGVAAARYLSPDVFGDERGRKPSEHALSELSRGRYWVPGDDAPLDAAGNIKASEIRAILSHLSLHDDPSKNLSDRQSARLKRGIKKKGETERRKYAANGQRGSYFVGHDKNGTPLGVFKYAGVNNQVLWILRFVDKPPHYRKILPARQIVDQVIEKRASYHVEQEIEIRLQRRLAGKP